MNSSYNMYLCDIPAIIPLYHLQHLVMAVFPACGIIKCLWYGRICVVNAFVGRFNVELRLRTRNSRSSFLTMPASNAS